MKRIMPIVSAVLAALLILFLFASCGFGTDQTQQKKTAAKTPQSAQVDENGATVITFDGSSAEIAGAGAAVSGTDVLIQSGGTYTVRGTASDSRIVVDADKADVTLVLDNAQITSAKSCALYVYKANLTTVYAKEGTQNSLTDGESYDYGDAYSSAADEEPDACLYAKEDLILSGSGTLTVNGNHANGVTGNDTLQIADMTLTVDAANNGVTGKDSLTVQNADVTVTAGGDGLRSTNSKDASLGCITAENAALSITAGEDGVQAQTALSITDTSLTVTTGGGSDAQIDENDSAKGIKAGTDITISGADGVFDCADDAIHADGNVTIHSGKLTAKCADDAIHAENAVTIEDGEIDVTAHEGVEGTLITINAGKISIKASDDGINAAQKTSDVTPTVEINGGELTIEMGQGDTDAIDANGDIIINGGTIRITAQFPFDYDGKGELNGGTVYVNGEQITQLTNQFGGMGGGRPNGMPGAFSGDPAQMPGSGDSAQTPGSGDPAQTPGAFSGNPPQGMPGERAPRPNNGNAPNGGTAPSDGSTPNGETAPSNGSTPNV